LCPSLVLSYRTNMNLSITALVTW